MFFVAVYRGATVSQARIVGATTSPQVVRYALNALSDASRRALRKRIRITKGGRRNVN